MDELYASARDYQSNEVDQWFRKKDKVKMCFLSSSKEEKTTNLGCATVFLEMLQNAGLINIKHETMRQGRIEGDSITEPKRKIIVELVPGARHIWLYLGWDGIMHVCLKSCVDTINDSHIILLIITKRDQCYVKH